MSLIIFV